MLNLQRSLRWLILSSWLIGLASGLDESQYSATAPKNANHIFNAIHSAMRQWGSSLNHNGMSFFLATVPRGTQFYHGTSTPDSVSGSEWLAFEPEHAMGFARGRSRGPPRDGKGPDNDDHHEEQRAHTHHSRTRPDWEQQPFRDEGKRRKGKFHDSAVAEGDAGYLHTYVAAKDLRLIYLDGMAAGKSSIGTLDASDRIFYNDSLPSGEDSRDSRRHSGPGAEGDRADLGCKMADEDLNGRIDGIIRMEAGFEIILCHFERDLEVVRITQAKSSSQGPQHFPSRAKKDDEHKGPGGGPGGGPPGGGGNGGGNGWITAITARYHNIGGHRVRLDFDNFVTAYTYDLDLFSQDEDLPRLTQFSNSQLEPLREDVYRLIKEHDPPTTSSFDWQAIADMIVTRYSDELHNLANGNFSSASELRQRAERLLGMFIDYNDPNNSTAIIERCTDQFIPKYSPRNTLSGQVVSKISRAICSNITAALRTEDVEETVEAFQRLKAYLQWTTWKQCRGCGYDQVCLIPMWPMGTVEDHEHPTCQGTDSHGRGGENYWGGFGGGPGGHGP